MKLYFYADEKITDKELHQLHKDYSAFIKEHTGISPVITTTSTNFTDYPVYPDNDGDARPEHGYVKRLVEDVEGVKGKFGVDHIFLLIHEDNWKSSGPKADALAKEWGTKPGNIWGVNFSYVHGPYHVHYCRYDKDNLANAFGTVYHETHHSFDALCKVETREDITPLLKVDNYDRDCTHGNAAHWDYIRYKENAESLALIKDHLVAAYEARREKEQEEQRERIWGLKKTLLGLLKRKLYQLRAHLNRKNGLSG